MVSRWSFAFTRIGLKDVFRRLKNLLISLLEDVLTTLSKRDVATSISGQFKTSLEAKLRSFYDVFVMSLSRLSL